MRKAALFTLGVVAAACPGAAQVFVIGADEAQRCYQAAAAEAPSTEARAACDFAIGAYAKGDDRLVASYVNRGILRMLARDVSGALIDLDAAIALDPMQPEAWLNRGVALVRAGRSAEAVRAFDAALAKQTRRPALAHFGRAYAHENMGAVTAAYRDLKQAATLSPKWDAPRRELRRFRVRGAGDGSGQGAP